MSWHWLIDETNLPPDEKLVALVLARHKNHARRAWPSVARISRLTGFCERKVQYALRSLERRDLVDRFQGAGGRGKPAVYFLRQRQLLLLSNGNEPIAGAAPARAKVAIVPRDRLPMPEMPHVEPARCTDCGQTGPSSTWLRAHRRGIDRVVACPKIAIAGRR